MIAESAGIWRRVENRSLTVAVLMATALTVTPLFAESVDRSVAEWTLTMGGRVGLAGQTRRISDIADLPAGDIQVEVLDWVGMNVDPPDLERLGGLTHLKEL